MRLTTKGRYAVTAMLDLALHGDKGPVSLADISGRQAISLSYLEQLFARLRRLPRGRRPHRSLCGRDRCCSRKSVTRRRVP